MTTTRTPGDQEALENLREKYPELQSIRSIAEIPEDEFVERYANDLHCDAAQARRVHQLANDISNGLALIWANIKAASSPYLNQTLFNNIPAAFLEQQQSIPGYDRLFGGLDFIAYDHARSIFGPAAYFVDLMRFVEAHITSRAAGVPDPLKLENRRPDLAKIKLDKNNTFDLIPYIDVVNRVLEAIIETKAKDDAYAVIEAAGFPMNLPFNLPLEQIRAYLQKLKTDLSTIYTAFGANSAGEDHLARETLGLSPHEYDLITTRITRVEDLEKIYGGYGLDPTFQLTRGALGYLQTDGLPSEVLRGLENVKNEHFMGSDAEQEFLDRIRKEIGAAATKEHREKILKRADRRLSKVQVFLDQTGLSRTELNDLIYQDLDRHEINVGQSHLFYINNVDDGLGYLMIEQDPVRPHDPTADSEFIVGLSPQKLDRIYRFLKLARRLDWSFADLDWALRSLVEPYEPETSLKFDGVNDYIGCRDVSANLVEDEFTVEAWVYPFSPRVNPIVAKGDGGRTHFAFWIDADGRLAFYNAQIPSADAYIRSQGKIPTGAFSHVALAVDGNTLIFYINGTPTPTIYSPKLASVQLFQFTGQSEPYLGTQLNIGHNLEDSYFEGLIKELRVWKKKRTAAEIVNTRYRRSTGHHADLVGYWPMAETHSNRILDYSVNENHGEPGGTTFVTQPVFVQRDLVLDPLPRLQVYRFNGIDQYLATETFSENFSALTIEAWLNIEAKGVHPVVVCGSDQKIHFLLWVDESGRLNFRSGTSEAQSRTTVKPDQRTHVAVTIAGDKLKFYVNGRGSGSATLSLKSSAGSTLRIGRNLGDDYFYGSIGDVRIWREARDSSMIKRYRDLPLVPVQWPGLAGYWRLDSIETHMYMGIKRNITLDLSTPENHLYLGGVLEDYIPTREPVSAATPVATFGTVLQLDGENDVITLRYPADVGLGYFESWTLAFWFKAQDTGPRQVIYTQGDNEAGLNIYVDAGKLYVVAWCADYGPSNLQETVLSAEASADAWHYLAVTSDESAPSDLIDFKGYFDGQLLDLESSTLADGTAGQKGVRLSQVGAAFLGGVGRTEGHTRFAGEEVEKLATHHLYYFGGQIVDLRLWKTAKPADAITNERYTAPTGQEDDLVAYIPLDEGQGTFFYDRAESDQICMPGAHEGKGWLSQRNAAFVAADTGIELENIYSHYQDGLDWTEYTYSGRLYFSDASSGIGVTFYSRYPESKDRFYRLERYNQQPAFQLTSHPPEPAGLDTAATDSGFRPESNKWYRFSIAITSETRIRVKLWPDGNREPDDPVIDVIDRSANRLTAGTVGLWAYGPGEKRFDDLKIIRDGVIERLLRESFEADTTDEDPTGWVDTGFRPYFDRESDLFATQMVGNPVLGTDSNAINIHSHYADRTVDFLTWSHYEYSGRMLMTDAGNGIGVTFFSHYFQGQDRYYRLRRYRRTPRFHLSSHTAKISSSEGTEIGLDPQADTWYRFRIEVRHVPDHPQARDGNGATVIKAKLWQDGVPEPADFAIDVLDYSNPLKFGTVGIWSNQANDPNYFDDLKVVQLNTTGGQPAVVVDETFESYVENEDPSNWRATGANNSPAETPGLFKVMVVGNKMYGPRTGLVSESLHTHYMPEGIDVLGWRDYVYTGRIYVASADSGIGVTFYSRYPASQDRYYRLRRHKDRPAFHLASHPRGIQTVKGDKAHAEIPSEPDTWYRFRVELRTIDDDPGRVSIRVKVWQDEELEPDDFQIEAYDDSARHITSGTVGIWASESGYVDDLRVGHELLLDDDFQVYAVGERPNRWQDTGADYSLEPVGDVCGILDLAGNRVFGTENTLDNSHSHFIAAEVPAEALNNYVYSGRMRMTDASSGIGITFFSQFPDEAVYYRLGRLPQPDAPFKLIGYPEGRNGREISRINKDAEVKPEIDTWYRFLVEVKHDANNRQRRKGLTTIRIKLWRDGDREPAEYQYEGDDSSRPIRFGTVGVWTAGAGAKYFDDLKVSLHRLLLETDFEQYAVDQKASAWHDTEARGHFADAEELFKKIEYSDNMPRWQSIDDYPLWLNALALRFDGDQQYLAAPARADFNTITIEALLQMDASQENPILGAGESPARRPSFWFGINSKDQLTLMTEGKQPQAIAGATVIMKERITHVACSIDGTSVNFYVNGQPDANNPLLLDALLTNPPGDLEIGRNTGDAHFNGAIQFVRLWGSTRTPAQIEADVYYSRHRIMSGDDHDDLLAYWTLQEPDGLYAANLTRHANTMRLGGVERARYPIYIDAHLKPDDAFWRYDRPVLGFAGADDLIAGVAGDAGTRQRRAVAIWFRVEDAAIGDRKQVIYHEGNADRGLVIYVHAGQLHFGGYNGVIWDGSWLATDRIRSGRWHHAVLVLDGRRQVRRGALQAYLDGKLVGVEPGSQLDNHRPDFTLGGVAGAVRWQKPDDSAAHDLHGQIMSLEIWDTVLAPDVIRNLSLAQPGGGTTPILSWVDDTLLAQAGTDRQKLLGSPPVYPLPQPRLGRETLVQLAAVVGLLDRHNLNLDRLTALWAGIKHVGREDQQVLFDQVFNVQVDAASRWDYHLDPIRWDLNSNLEQDRAIRSRLLAALRVSDQQLKLLIAILSGESASLVVLNRDYLLQLYRLAQLPRVLRLDLPQLTRLLKLMNLPGVRHVGDFLALSDRAAWLNRIGMTVSELDFFTNDIYTDRVSVGVPETAIRDLADELRRQRGDFLANGESFVSDNINQFQSLRLFDLMAGKIIDANGAIKPDYARAADIENLNTDPAWLADLRMLAHQLNWSADLQQALETIPQWLADLYLSLAELGLGNAVIEQILQKLQGHGLLRLNGFIPGAIDDRALRGAFAADSVQAKVDLPSGVSLASIRQVLERWRVRQQDFVANLPAALEANGLTDNRGVVLDTALDGVSLTVSDSALTTSEMAGVHNGLEQRKALQDHIGATLLGLRSAYDSVMRESLATLWDADADITQAVIDHLKDLMPPARFLELMLNIQADQPIPEQLAGFAATGGPVTSGYLYQLGKTLYLVAKFDLTAAETRALLAGPEVFSVKNVLNPDLVDLDHLYTYGQLRDDFADGGGQLLALLELQSGVLESTLDAISTFTDWDRQQLAALAAYFNINQPSKLPELNQLKVGFDLVQLLGVDVDFLIRLAATDPLDLSFYQQQAAALLDVLKAKYDEQDWPAVYRPIHDELAVKQRDALLSLVMLNVGPAFEGRRDPDLLSEYLLMDVQTGSEVDTSYIQQAIAGVQLYVQRGLMNLELGIKPEWIPKDQWEWMKNYRVWEANRKVFLYPENYIEPELRDTKTPIFAELEQELMQSDINQESVTRAYVNYLDRFAEVANLKVVGSYRHRDVTDCLYLIGRTDTQPKIYYYREYTVDQSWLPWQKIDLTINADHATPVFAFNRLFLFWSEFTKTTKSVERQLSAQIRNRFSPVYLFWRFLIPQLLSDAIKAGIDNALKAELSPEEIQNLEDGNWFIDIQGYLYSRQTEARVQVNVDIYQPVVKFSYLNFGQTWVQPQVYREPDRELREHEHVRHEWQRVYVQRLTELRESGSRNVAPKQEQNARVLEIDKNTSIAEPLQISDTRKLTWSFWVNFVNHTSPQRQRDAINIETVTLFNYDDRLSMSATNLVAEIAGIAAERAAYQAAAVAASAAVVAAGAALAAVTDDKNDQAAISAAVFAEQRANTADLAADAASATAGVAGYVRQAAQAAKEAANSARGAAAAGKGSKEAGTAADKAQIAANNANTAATHAETTYDGLNKWESISLALTLKLDAQTTTIVLGYSWQHVALTMSYAQGEDKYSVNLYKDGGVANTTSLSAIMLPDNGTQHIGLLPANQDNAYDVHLSDFRLWDYVQDAVKLNETRSVRQTGLEKGLIYYLPLNEVLPTALMRLALSELTFALPQAAVTPIRGLQRERIIVFYGDEVRSMRSDFSDDQAAHVTVDRKRFPNVVNYDLDLSLSKLHVALTNGLSMNDYAEGEESTLSRFTPAAWQNIITLFNDQSNRIHPWYGFWAKVIQDWLDNRDSQFNDTNYLLNNVSRFATSLMDVGNQPGWYLLSTDDEQFLIRAEISDLPTTGDRLQISYGSRSSETDLQPVSVYFDFNTLFPLQARLRNGSVGQTGNDATEFQSPSFTFRFERLSTNAVQDLSLNFFRGGIDELLSLESQQAREKDFIDYEHNTALVVPPARYNGEAEALDFDGAYGLYYREIFFHIPFLIANRLNANQNFADAQKWYHYIFDPTAQETSGTSAASPKDRYWRFLPFRKFLQTETLADIFTGQYSQGAISEYLEDPLDPHAIARLRVFAYQKAIVMKYIDNLLDWGDYLFGQDTRESINEAAQLYILAFNLLGPRPQAKTVKDFSEIGDFDAIKRNYAPLPDFVTHFEPKRASIAGMTLNSDVVTTFGVPENADFIGYWDRVEDRLFKIRHSLNIEGIFRQLALFEPPLDIRALVQSFAGGRGIGSALADLSVPVPHYRYAFMLGKAKEMVEQIMGLGSALQSAIESRDAERLALLQNTHEKAILNLTTAIKTYEVDEAKGALVELAISKQSVQNRVDQYTTLIDSDLSGEEIAELVLIGAAQVSRSAAMIAKGISASSYAVPDIVVGGAGAFSSPVALAITGGKAAGEISGAIAEIAEFVADILSTAGTMTAKMGEYKRRKNGWKLELQTGQYDLQGIEQQIELAQIKLQMTQRELEIHHTSIQHNQEIESFYRRKFSNEDLHNWMISRLSGLYFQAYKLAYDMAKAAEKAMQYELPSTETFINFGHWDSLRKGLLAGESLLLELNRMEKTQLEQDSRFLEIEKIISMKQTLPGSLLLLMTEGACDFQLSEALFDRDYPGHYFRVLKTVAISIKVPGEPYQTVKAALTQMGSKALLEPNIDAVRYLLGDPGVDQPAANVVRTNWRANQQIALSKVDEDLGMFALDFFFDDRYFPFEGTGAVSMWRLEMPAENNPGIDLSAIEDVIIHLRYTAKSDRGAFKDQVSEVLKQYT